MKKKLIVMMLAVCVLAGGCGGVSKGKYNAVADERDKLKTENQNLEKAVELREKIAGYQARIESEYEHAEFVIYVAGKVSNGETEESAEAIGEAKDSAINALEVSKKIFNEASGLADISGDTLKSTSEGVDEIYEAWGGSYGVIKDIERHLMSD